MAVINNGLPTLEPPSGDGLVAWEQWVAGRPESVRSVCEKFVPWEYYEMPKTGQVVLIEAYSEDGTVRVLVVADRISIPAIASFGVFGVDPGDLIKWAGAAPGEGAGSK